MTDQTPLKYGCRIDAALNGRFTIHSGDGVYGLSFSETEWNKCEIGPTRHENGKYQTREEALAALNSAPPPPGWVENGGFTQYDCVLNGPADPSLPPHFRAETAARIAAAMYANPDTWEKPNAEIAGAAVRQADALIAALTPATKGGQ